MVTFTLKGRKFRIRQKQTVQTLYHFTLFLVDFLSCSHNNNIFVDNCMLCLNSNWECKNSFRDIFFCIYNTV